MNPAIVVVTYNRPASLSRLLTFLHNGCYDVANVSLIISIDYQDSDQHNKVVDISNSFNWRFGQKKIIEHKKNLGLKEHVLSCGDLSEEYGAVIVLEDDIVVSRYFYNYALNALRAYDHDFNIAGISLYGFEWSQVADRAFLPAHDGADVYFCQNAQSWGQLWSKRMWQEFKEWYINHKNLEINPDIPDNVKNWSAKSWLKYHIWYCVEKNKYFVYPYVSLSTNYSDIGEHLKGDSTHFQVSLLTGRRMTYQMPPFDSNSCRYDVFFERQQLGSFLGFKDDEVCIDLYGKKKNRENKRYWLTSLIANFQIIKSFGLQLKPHELNIIFGIEGSEIFLYDTQTRGKNKRMIINFLEARRTLYDIKEVPSKKLIEVLKYRLFKKLKNLKISK